jgi:EAL domain-containing protein (putative c-di-GMP-specific phosphodiesterase class I)
MIYRQKDRNASRKLRFFKIMHWTKSFPRLKRLNYPYFINPNVPLTDKDVPFTPKQFTNSLVSIGMPIAIKMVKKDGKDFMENLTSPEKPAEISESPSISLLEIIEQKSVASFFQPIVSIKKIGVVGLEALGRGVESGTQRLIEPQDLYKQLEKQEPKLALDRLFRDKGLEGYAQIRSKIPGLLLFLNIESSILTTDVVGSGHLLKKVMELHLDPSNIVIEICQSEGTDGAAIQKFVEAQRANNFLIALEGINGSRDKLTQVLNLSPDVVKLESGLVQGMAKDSYKREGVRTVVHLSQKLGALVTADGVENEEDALAALDLGVDMLQGNYFSKPQKNDSATLGLKARIVFMASRYRRMMTERMSRDKERRNRCNSIAVSIFEELAKVDPDDQEKKLGDFFLNHPQLECLYLLNQDGVQVSETICNLRKVPMRKQFLFQPAPPGTDHSLKEYFYGLTNNHLTRYLTEPYISLASGNLCITFTGVLTNPETGKTRLLCADIDVSQV